MDRRPVLLLSTFAAAGELHALLVNGGASESGNYQSHLDHLQQMRAALLARGVPAANITIFSADGDDPEPDLVTQADEQDDWLLLNTRAQFLLSPRSVNTEWPEVELNPARRDTLSSWFARAAADLHSGDTLFLYATDHGTEAGLDLWHEDQLSPTELRSWLDGLPTGVRVVMVMSQCHSGTFYDALLDGHGDACGFFSVPRDRKAYGCYAGGSEDRIGHGFAFIDALAPAGSVGEAHDAVWVGDDSPDVPLRSSDIYLGELVEQQARKLRISTPSYVASVFAQAPLSPAELRPLQALTLRFGLPLTDDLRDLEATSERVRRAEDELERTTRRWTDLLGRLNNSLLERVGDAAVDVESEDRGRLTRQLRDRAAADGTLALASAVYGRGEAASDAWWRSLTREAVNERLRNALVRLAGERLTNARPRERARLTALRTCEATPLGHPAPASTSVVATPWPALDEDGVEAQAPATIGVRFDPRKSHLQLTGVDPGGPAAEAGLQTSDIIRSIDGVSVDRVTAGAWLAIAPPGRPLRLEVVRQGAVLTFLVRPERMAP